MLSVRKTVQGWPQPVMVEIHVWDFENSWEKELPHYLVNPVLGSPLKVNLKYSSARR